jgi:hypothetical protein
LTRMHASRRTVHARVCSQVSDLSRPLKTNYAWSPLRFPLCFIITAICMATGTIITWAISFASCMAKGAAQVSNASSN